VQLAKTAIHPWCWLQQLLKIKIRLKVKDKAGIEFNYFQDEIKPRPKPQKGINQRTHNFIF